MKIHILDRAKKKKFIAGLENLGMKKIPELLIRSGKEKIRAYSGDLSTEQIMEIWRLLPIEGVGLYVGKDMVNRSGVREVRLSLDGMHLWKDQLTDRNFILNVEQEELWFNGKDIELTEDQIKAFESGFVCVKSSDSKDFVGVGKIGRSPATSGIPPKEETEVPFSSGKTLFSFLPKERRRKSQTI